MIKKQKMRGKVRIELTDEFLAQQGHTQESYRKLSKGGRWSVRNRAKHNTKTQNEKNGKAK